jgi:Fe-S-cluster-containing hydrogenase component 2
LRTYRAGACIIKEGETIAALYILRSGSATVARSEAGRENVLNFLGAGSLFGERGFLDDHAVRAATITATVASDVICIDAAPVRDTLARTPALRAAFSRAVQTQLAQSLRATVTQTQSTGPAGKAAAISDFLLSKGVGEATNVFIIDETICTRCGNCEQACAATHGGISRVSRELGASAEQILIPLACRHCETPHCMANCPVDAISRTPTGEVIINQQTCIGCEKCAEDCPYDVISMVDIGARKRPNWLVRMLATVGLARPADARIDTGAEHEKKALKCDLCSSAGGIPACVTACPTGAAVRIAPEAYMTWLREGSNP